MAIEKTGDGRSDEPATSDSGHPARRWRGWIAAGLFILVSALALLMFRPSGRPSPPAETAKELPPAAETPTVPAPPPPLTRADLIQAASLAADAHASGKPPPVENASLVGRRFVFQLPFGCEGPGLTSGAAAASWSYDEEQEILRAEVTPEDWTDAPLLRELARERVFDAAEGFWIRRPWISSADCPVRKLPSGEGASTPANGTDSLLSTEAEPGGKLPVPPPPAPETLGIVELYAQDAPRSARRNGRPYRLTAKVTPGELDLSKGLRLVIEGRLVELAGGQPIACRQDSPGHRPLCLISSQRTRIAVTDASGERVLAEWID